MPDVPGWERPTLRAPALSQLLGLQEAASATLPHAESDGYLGPRADHASHEADSWGQTTSLLTAAPRHGLGLTSFTTASPAPPLPLEATAMKSSKLNRS